MKFILLTLLIFSSNVFAHFTCVPSDFALFESYLITSQGQQIEMQSTTDCQNAVKESVNGFICIPSPQLSYKALLIASNGQVMYRFTRVEDCQKALADSK